MSNLILLIYFDEMGLAEISNNNNPLKVLHSELEYVDYENKIVFICISNWAWYLRIKKEVGKDKKIFVKNFNTKDYINGTLKNLYDIE